MVSGLSDPRHLEVVPVTKTVARQFVTEHHRHNEAPTPAQTSLAVGLEADGVLVAVATAGYPVSRMLNDGRTLEVNRVCVGEITKNANSIMYGAIGRAAQALGFKRLVTYTLTTESGASLRAAGFTGPIQKQGSRSWVRPNQPDRVRTDVTLWGERKNAAGIAKFRWERAL
jgi:hypothetical protein